MSFAFKDGALSFSSQSTICQKQQTMTQRSASMLSWALWLPFQVHVFTPNEGRPLSGLVRALVKDSNDNSAPIFLDSDGMVNNDEARSHGSDVIDINDGKWHMITLSTSPTHGKGYRMYVDGALAAAIPNLWYEGTDAAPLSGGDVIKLDGPIHLCNRADDEPDRGFTGAVSQLTIFDESLTADQVAKLYKVIATEPGTGETRWCN